MTARVRKLNPRAKPLRQRVSKEEWQVRVDLAAAYRLAAYYRMTDQIYTHFSARVPGAEEHFLLNPYGYLFEEVTASSLVKIDLAGKVLEDETGLGVNEAGFVIHSAVHAARPDLHCVLHTHTSAGIAVSAQKEGLLMLSQHAARFHDRVAYHDFEGVALDMDERTRLVADLGGKKVMILRNHGLLACGPRVADAFDELYFLERACQAQVAALSGGRPVNIISDETAEHAARQFERPGRPALERHWPTQLRMLDRIDPSFRD